MRSIFNISTLLKFTGTLVLVLMGLAGYCQNISGVTIQSGDYKVGDDIVLTAQSDGTGFTLDPTSTVNGVLISPIALNEISGNKYEITYTVSNGDMDRANIGSIPLSIILVDGVTAGTAFTGSATGGTVTIDANRPTLQSLSIGNSSNTAATLTFSEGVYRNNDGTGVLRNPEEIGFSITGSSAALGSVNESHTEGASSMTFTLSWSTEATGSDQLIASPAGANDVFDAAGNAMLGTQSASVGLNDKTAPVIAVDAKSTNDPTPELTGTIDDPAATITITVDGQTNGATNNGDGTWTLADGTLTALTGGTYNISASAADGAGNIGTDNTSNELEIDVQAPVGYTVDILGHSNDEGEWINLGNHDDIDFQFTTAETGTTYNYSFDDANGGTPAIIGSGTVTSATQTIPMIDISSLDDGTITLTVTLTDGAGNTGADATDNLVKDTEPPTFQTFNITSNNSTGTVTFNEGVFRDDGNNPLRENDEIDFSLDSSPSLSPNGNGATNFSHTEGSDTFTFDFDFSGTASGSESMEVSIDGSNDLFDAAGNQGSTSQTISETLNDLLAPNVTVDALITNDQTPELTGTVDDNTATILVSVGAQLNIPATNNMNGTWTLADNTLTTLGEGVYDVSVAATDPSTNAGSDNTNPDLEIDITEPMNYTAQFDQDPINTSNHTSISFTITDAGSNTGETYNYSIDDENGATPAVTGSGTLSSASEQIDNLDISSLDNDVDLALTVTLSDDAGNVGADATDNARYDTNEINIGTVSITNVEFRTSVDVNFVADEPGTFYWIIVDNCGGVDGQSHLTTSSSEIKTDAVGSNNTLGTASVSASNDCDDPGDRRIHSRGSFIFTAGAVSQTIFQDPEIDIREPNGIDPDDGLNDFDIYFVAEGDYSEVLQTNYGEVFDIEASNTKVTNATIVEANGAYGIGTTLNIELTFEDPVTVNETGGTPYILLETGTTDRQASYDASQGNNSTTLYFTYTIQEGDVAAVLDYIDQNSLKLNGGTMEAGGEPINEDMPVVGGGNSLSDNKTIEVDGIRPIFSNITPSSGAILIPVGGTLSVDLVSNETGLTLVGPALINGIDVGALTDDGDNTYSLTYNILEGHANRAAGAIPISLTVQDQVGNTQSFTAFDANTFAIDANTPTITVLSISPDNGGRIIGQTITVVLQENANETGLFEGAGSVINGEGISFQDLGGGSYSYTYTLQDGQTDWTSGNLTMDLRLRDAAGNTVTTTAIPANTMVGDANYPDITPVTIASNNGANSNYAKIGDQITVTATSNEPLTIANTTNSNSNFTSGAAPSTNTGSFVTGGTNPYTISYTADAADTEGDVEFSIDLFDVAGNKVTINTETDASTVTFDRTDPFVQTIEIASAIESWGTNATSASSVTFDVTFNEDVTNVTTDDFEIETQKEVSGADALVSGSITGIFGSGQSYSVTVSSITGTGRLKINLKGGTDIIDIANNTTAAFGETFADNHFYSITYPEATNDVTNADPGVVKTTEFEVTWDEPLTPVQPATHYLIQLRNTAGAFAPVADGDGSLLTPDTDLSDNNLSRVELVGSVNTNFTGLASGTEYFFRIIPLTYSTNNTTDVIDLKTGSPATTSGFTTTGDIGTITAGPGIEPASISALTTSRNSATPPQLDAVLNFDFVITDDGADNTIDNSPTKLGKIIFRQANNNQVADWSAAFAGAELSTSGATAIIGTVNSGNITFSSIPSSSSGDFGFIDDGTPKTFTLKVWFRTDMGTTLQNSIDEKFLEFTVSEALASFEYNNTSQASSTIGAAEALESGDNTNRVSVDAVDAAFTFTTTPFTNPTNNIRGLGVTENFEVQARDQNGNLDLGIDAAPTVTTANPDVTFTLSNTTFLNGIYNSDITYTATGDGTNPSDGTITVATGVLDATTNPVDINHVTVTGITGGVETNTSLFGGSVNRNILGWQVTGISGPISTPELDDIIIRFGADINPILENLRLFRSANPIFDGSAVNITSNVTITPGTDFITITGIDDDISPDPLNRNYFLVVDIVATVDGSTAPITPSITASGLPDQDVRITTVGSSTVSGSVDASVTGLTYRFIDILAPTVVALTPVNGSLSHPRNTALSIQFDEEVTGNSNINIYDEASNTLLYTIPPIAPLNRGFVATYDITGLLGSDIEYYILMAPDEFLDDSGNGFPGFATKNDWAFKTADETPPVFDPVQLPETVNITDVGFDLRVALDEPGTVWYLIVDNDPATDPTVSEVRSGTFAGLLDAGSFSVDRGFEYIYTSILNDNFSGENDFKVYLTAEDNQPTPNAQTTVYEMPLTPFAGSSTAGVQIVSNPDTKLDICNGDFQRVFTPIAFQESEDNDFSNGNGQTVNLALPAGYLFKTDGQASATGQGGNISNVALSYINNQVARITFDISGTNSRDKILLQNLEIIATDDMGSGNLIRLGGSAFISDVPDGATVVELETFTLTPVQFSTIPDLTSIGDNIPKVALVPDSDDGINIFSGPGVVGDTLFTVAAGIGIHEIILTNTNDIGCNTTFSKEIEIYDNDRAVRGLDPSYCADVPEAIIPIDGREFYLLNDLTVRVPDDLDPDLDSVLVQSIFQDQFTGDFIFRPNVFETAENRARLGDGDLQDLGGYIGDLEFTGTYINQFTNLPDVVTQRVTIFLSPRASLTIQFQDQLDPRPVSNEQYCEDDETILFQGFPTPSATATGVFTINSETNFPGLTDLKDGRATLNPAALKSAIENGAYSYGTFNVSYTYTDLGSECPNTITQDFTFNPNPMADFAIGTACEGLDITFTDLSSGVGVTQWNWLFEDPAGGPEVVSNDKNPVIGLYNTADRYEARLTVTTDAGCPSSQIVKNVDVGQIPNVEFDYAGISIADDISFSSTSTVTSNFTTDAIDLVNWDFGDGTSSSSANMETVNHKYSATGIYTARMIVESSFGCLDSANISVFIVPDIAVTKSSPYTENFENSDGGWLTYSPDSSSWEVARIKSTTVDTRAWKTNANKGSYYNEEESYLYTPLFDFSELERAVVQFARALEFLSDEGVVLQYSTDSLNIGDPEKQWTGPDGGTLGFVGSGQEWYNDFSVTSNPGEQITGNYAWNGTARAFKIAKHTLTDISRFDSTRSQRVVFRFALAAGPTSKKRDGFTLDNFVIRDGTRTVLLESFTNMTAGTTPTQNNFIRDFELGNNPDELVTISYHTNSPGADVINKSNTSDPLSRSLYYGVTSVPSAQLDGSYWPAQGSDEFTSSVRTESSLRSLDEAPVVIGLDATLSQDQLLNAEVEITVINDTILDEDVILHVALVEKQIMATQLGFEQSQNGESEFNWALRKLLPTSSGTIIPLTDIDNDGEKVSITLDPYFIQSVFDTTQTSATEASLNFDNLAIIAFIQGERTKIVYQSTYYSNFTNKEITVTGLEDKLVADGMKMYPNPARDYTMVEFGEIPQQDYNLKVYDHIGQVVIEKVISNGQRELELATSQLSAGMFIVQLETESEVLRKEKLIVVH